MASVTGSDEFYLNLWMPTNSYVALSFGGTHIDSDMIVFVTETGADSKVYDMYSDEVGEPKYDDDLVLAGDLEVKEIVAEYPHVRFSITRKLDTKAIRDYLFSIDKVI
eukprot:CAMPEP_0185583884 /NCGR_PEP_ID=MMETSP0434-20130131/28466_1 /TAXON_ID=626734 ORGANISM="Favella taraikaensis, Strain Fe Narragansett Bay" /NCGR_SAMPLE_ID=MMETSP0434 /ASSEMBLY_ACC=CAM_ASM_000379 /LENGTH=107 /DNA_ID=CAMNT_0028203285 /DNA_START=8 /DNA_END=331 /DNA_ORIENTATION=+